LADVLRLTVSDDARVIAAPSPVLDPATSAVVEQAVAAARAQAYAAGAAAGRQAASAASGAAVVELAGRLDALVHEVAAQRETAGQVDVALAVELASEVLSATPPASALEVLDRVRDAATVLDDDPLAVHLHPDDHAMLADAPLEARLRLVADPSVGRGDARLVGAWGGAEVARAALLDAVTAQRLEAGR